MIYLSICIPTFNRSEQLKAEIESIVSQKEFLDKEVEIVISDNASTDRTSEIIQEYTKKFDNIIYNRNSSNIGVSNNIYNVLTKANGLYRKISNDTFLYYPESLKIIVEVVKKYLKTKPLLFFTNNYLCNDSTRLYDNIDVFFKKIGVQITSDVVHGYWAEDLQILNNIDVSEWFWTIRFVLCAYSKKNLVYICNESLFDIQHVDKKDISYGLFYVFYKKQFSIYDYYQSIGLIRKKTVNYLEKNLLFDFFLQWLFHYKRQDIDVVFSREENLSKCIRKHYCKKPYFCLFIFKYFYLNMKYFIKKIVKL